MNTAYPCDITFDWCMSFGTRISECQWQLVTTGGPFPFPSLFSPYTSLCLIRTKSTSVSVPFCVRILVKWQSTVCFEFCQSPGSCYYSLLSSTCSHSLGSKIRGYSSSPESQVLTLADLTPPTSDVNISTRFRNGGSSLGISQPLRSSYPDLRNGTSHLSPRDAEVSGGCPLVSYSL